MQNVGKRIERLSQSASQRRALLEMDSHMLRDIGISRAEAIQMSKGH
ncbi:MAG: DUF1127 domain-containing protein [Desulfuromusa sp.]|nr:DUF1127 domain-containing protein [Desulfuromusa sp.]